MDSVLSVEGSQIYRQRAFNKKQVARKVPGRAVRDVSTFLELECVKMFNAVIGLSCVSVHVTRRREGRRQGREDTGRD